MKDVVLSPTGGFPQDVPGSSQFFGRGTFGKVVGALRKLDAWAKRRDVLVLTDGTTFDDRAALAILALSPRWRLQGVIATAGAATRKQPESESGHAATTIQLAVDPVMDCLQALPLKKLPKVVPGQTAPFSADSSQEQEWQCQAADFIIEVASAHSHRNRLTVVVLGASTDLAFALGKDPALEEKIDVVAAAFDKWPDGGQCSKVKLDVGAWQVIMDSSVPLTIASSEVARKSLTVSPQQALSKLRAKPKSGEEREAVLAWLDAEQVRCACDQDGEATALPGLLAVAYALGRTESTMYQRPAVTDDGRFLHGGSTEPLPCQTCIGEPRIHWITAVDERRLWGELMSTLSSCGEKPEAPKAGAKATGKK